jgi:hypothetical protein
MFRLLGLVAALNVRFNRIRINLVPLNLLAAGLLLYGVSSGLTRVMDGPADPVPLPVTVADLASGRVRAGSFVRVTGFVEPALILELGRRGASGKMRDVDERLRLLHDGSSPAVWLQPGTAPIPAAWTPATFVGMVRPLPAAAQNATNREGATLSERRPSPDVLLENGTQPRSFASSVWLLATCTPPLVLLAWVTLRRNQIFRAGRHVALDEGSPYELIDLRVSGRLRLTQSTSRRFLEVGARMERLENGGLAVLANVDASTYFMGIRAIRREGTWTLAIPAGAALSIVAGELALGCGVRPAARVSVRVGGRVTERFTLTFGSVAQRNRVLQALNESFVVHPHAAAA